MGASGASPMNIFFLSSDPATAARWHGDKHVIKMLLESTQLLWTAQHVAYAPEIVPDLESAPTTMSSAGRQHGYRLTHRNHPCAIWTRATIGNYRWLVALARALATEYHWRWPARSQPHACEVHVEWLATHEPPLPALPLTMPATAMPPEYRISSSPTACYKAFYAGSKRARGITVYTRRDPPLWLSCG